MAEHFFRTVRGSGPGLLLAHGAGGGIAPNFGPIMVRLAAEYTVVGVDYPGTGATPRATAPLSLDDLADELVRAGLDAGLDTFAILGYSLGTAVAVRAASRHPDRVTALVLTAGFARPDNPMRLALDVWAALLDGDRRLLATFLTMAASGRSRLESLTPGRLDKSIDQLAGVIPPGSPEHVALAASVDTTGELAAITVPTLIVATTEDLLTPPVLSERLASGIPGAELIRIRSGHDIGTEAPDEWLDALTRFLAKAV
ncbi:pimeloyl-ACP methyl ester carboxylesterase [Herbihabitans rhizosphaerae]|uniref:Pimeloyl-ACP methyl ester carboxylesterase n=1 Tax=Herbihabitans rhizosphaerae TaxID=1872711 RepID=A0A4Q7L8H6_9PSEU|nr:alpha/beta fold hydrolase [Herbihabitans rhizosphaerae]RZS44702.1 pimeloyl-ACP methyl ester carboxylesterase [Herbihabitans rhizosphaerae]